MASPISDVRNLELKVGISLHVIQLNGVVLGIELRVNSRTGAHFTLLFIIYSLAYCIQNHCTKHQTIGHRDISSAP